VEEERKKMLEEKSSMSYNRNQDLKRRMGEMREEKVKKRCWKRTPHVLQKTTGLKR